MDPPRGAARAHAHNTYTPTHAAAARLDEVQVHVPPLQVAHPQHSLHAHLSQLALVAAHAAQPQGREGGCGEGGGQQGQHIGVQQQADRQPRASPTPPPKHTTTSHIFDDRVVMQVLTRGS